MTDTSDHQRPDWFQFAKDAIDHVAEMHIVDDDGDDEIPDPLHDREDETHRGKTAKKSQRIPRQKSSRATPGGAPRTQSGEPRVSLAQQFQIIQLCATFRSPRAIADMLRPGAITIVEAGLLDIETTEHLICSALLPAAIGPSPRPHLSIRRMDSRSSARESKVANRLLDEVLVEPGPLLVIVDTLTALDPELIKVVPASWRLVPPNRDILRTFIELRFGPEALGQMINQVPDDDSLSKLTPAALALALRLADPSAITAALNHRGRAQQDALQGLDAIEGYGEAECVARQMSDDLKAWRSGLIDWSDVQKSAIFYGAPGTGKSHLARALAVTAGAQLVRGNFASWQAAGHLGDMLAAMRDSFADAAASRPAVLVIDEIDSVGDRSEPDPRNANYNRQVVNAFLEQLDRISEIPGVIVIGTCNAPETIDAAVLRPGRFDVLVEVPLPGRRALRRILQNGLPEKTTDADLDHLARLAVGKTAADIEGALRAGRAAARRANRQFSADDIIDLIEKRDPRSTDHRHRIATHECGHAIVAVALNLAKPKRLALTEWGGGTWLQHEPRAGTLQDCDAMLTHLLAGRAAEIIEFGNAGAGSGGSEASDLARATRLAMHIDTRLGLGHEGLLWRGSSEHSYLDHVTNSARVFDRLQKAEANATTILEENSACLREMARSLADETIIEGPDLDEWLRDVRRSPVQAIGQSGYSNSQEPADETQNCSSS